MSLNGDNDDSTRSGSHRERAMNPRYIVEPTPANQKIYNRYRTRLDDILSGLPAPDAPDSTLPSPFTPSDGAPRSEDDGMSGTAGIADVDEFLDSAKSSLEASSSATRGRRSRGMRMKPLSSRAVFENVVVRKLNLACGDHRRKKLICTCNDLSLFERAWEDSRAPRTNRQPELAPKERTETPTSYLGYSQQNNPAAGLQMPLIQIPYSEEMDLATAVDSDSILPRPGSGSYTESSLWESNVELVAVEFQDHHHGYRWTCGLCGTSVDTIRMARDHYKESHLQRSWYVERTYRLQCESCFTMLEVYDFSSEPSRRFCLAGLGLDHKWHLSAYINTTTYPATGSEAMTGVESGFSEYLPLYISSFPPLYPYTDDGGTENQLLAHPSTTTSTVTGPEAIAGAESGFSNDLLPSSIDSYSLAFPDDINNGSQGEPLAHPITATDYPSGSEAITVVDRGYSSYLPPPTLSDSENPWYFQAPPWPINRSMDHEGMDILGVPPAFNQFQTNQCHTVASISKSQETANEPQDEGRHYLDGRAEDKALAHIGHVELPSRSLKDPDPATPSGEGSISSTQNEGTLLGVHSDSGYDTLTARTSFPTRSTNKLAVIREEANIDMETSGNMSGESNSPGDDNLDLITEFSDSGSLAAREGALAFKFAEKLKNDLGPLGLDHNLWGDVEAHILGVFKDFAFEVAQHTNNQVGRDTMFYVYKNRERITRSLFDMLGQDYDNEGEEEEEVAPQPDPDLAREKLARANQWVLGTERMPELQEHPNTDTDTDTDTDTTTSDCLSDEESIFDPVENEYQMYAGALSDTKAYRWLLQMLRREFTVASTEPDLKGRIRQKITEVFPRTKVSRHRQPQAYELTIETAWNPFSFFAHQQYGLPPHEIAEKVIVLIGSDTNAQATTCIEYMLQTWPATGQYTMDCFTGLLKNGSECSQTIGTGHNSNVSMSFRDNRFIGVTHGTRAFVTEISEQLVWLETALQVATSNDGIWFMMPHLSTQNVEPPNPVPTLQPGSIVPLRFQTTVERQWSEKGSDHFDGQCWHGLFQSVQIVQGYPISRRLYQESGLEISLGLMARLAQAQYLNVFRTTMMIKGFSTLLYPTKQTAVSTIWHLVYNDDGSHISFTKGLSCFKPAFEMSIVSEGRHILGWCKEARLYAGAPDASYMIDESLLPESNESCILNGAKIHQGKLLKGADYQLGLKDVPVHLGRFGSEPFSRCLTWLQTQKLVFWDEEDKRGWLVNGVSALLHLLRAYIEHTSERDLCDEFLLRQDSLVEGISTHTTKSAFNVLTNKVNQTLKLFRNEPATFADQLERFFNILEQMFSHQEVIDKQCLPSRGSERHRRYLEGWDFSEFAADTHAFSARFSEIPIKGRNWMDFARSMSAVVLFGRGFGEIIQPSSSLKSCRWAQIPRDEYYLACLIRDIQQLGQPWCSTSGSRTTKIGAKFAWHSRGQLFLDTCQCQELQTAKHEDPVQVLLPFGLSQQLHLTEDLGKKLYQHQGAVVLGHNTTFSWVWKDLGPPEMGDPLLYRDPEPRDTPSSDSGYLSQETGSNPTIPSEPEIGIICALSKELTAVWALLDCAERKRIDDSPYVIGHLAGYSIVATCLPHGQYGTNAAAATATNLVRTFPRLDFTLLIGIGGGIPSMKHDIRLGDVVVGLPANPQDHEIVQHDAGKTYPGRFEPKRSTLKPPPDRIRDEIAILEAEPNPSERPLDKYIQAIVRECANYAHPGLSKDILYAAEPGIDTDCSSNPESCKCKPQNRPPRSSMQPKVHYGSIASGNIVVKDAAAREELSRKHNVLCVEMEAAAIANQLQCLVIRGICDYADCHKNKIWQEYAAATAAAYAKYLLTQMRGPYHQKRKRKRGLSESFEQQNRSESYLKLQRVWSP